MADREVKAICLFYWNQKHIYIERMVDLMTINIYLSNLARYTEGRENGRWLQLPMELEKLEKVFTEIVGQNQEHIILDYNAPFEISEYENIFTLNEFMETLEDSGLDENGLKIIFEVADTKEDAINAINNGNYTIIDVDAVIEGWATCFVDDDILGRVLNEEGYNNLFENPIPEEMLDYMNWENIYNCLAINDGWQKVTIDNNDYLVTLRF